VHAAISRLPPVIPSAICLGTVEPMKSRRLAFGVAQCFRPHSGDTSPRSSQCGSRPQPASGWQAQGENMRPAARCGIRSRRLRVRAPKSKRIRPGFRRPHDRRSTNRVVANVIEADRSWFTRSGFRAECTERKPHLSVMLSAREDETNPRLPSSRRCTAGGAIGFFAALRMTCSTVLRGNISRDLPAGGGWRVPR